MPLISFISCKADYNDEDETIKSNEIEFKRLIECSDYIFYNFDIYIVQDGKIKKQLAVRPSGTCGKKIYKCKYVQQAFNKAVKWIVNDIKEHKRQEEKWDLLIASHIGKNIDKPYHHSHVWTPFVPHSGTAAIPFRILCKSLPIRTLFLDLCRSNQIDLVDIKFDNAIVSLHSVGYEGIVTTSFCQLYPDVLKIIHHLQQVQPESQWSLLSQNPIL